MKTQYAIKVPMAVDDYIYVTRPTGNMYEVEPVLYNTRKEAEEAAKIWGSLAKVVRFRKENYA